ncbi:MAG: hypothetical protein KAH48_02265, partial [Chlorobi bacterium]|nr:hypothetical protein [Chlorobiota bacterium]
EDIDGYSALDSAMKEQGSSLTAAWRDFIPWLYYTGDRAIPGEFFDHADEFPTLPNYLNEDPISFDSDISINKDGRLKLFEFRMYSFILPSKSENTDDTLSIILVNPDMKSAIIQNKLKRNMFSILCSENDGSAGMRPVPGTAYFYSVEAETDIIDSLYINSGYCTTGIAYAYPNPYKPGTGEALNFPLPSNAMINDIAHLSIMRSDMVSVYSADLPILAEDLNRVVKWDNIPNDLSSGIYIFKVTYKDEIKLGKFAVIR